jgi:hypothetical protein
MVKRGWWREDGEERRWWDEHANSILLRRKVFLEGAFQSGRSLPNNLHNNQKMHILLLGTSGRTGEPLMRIPIKIRFNIP